MEKFITYDLETSGLDSWFDIPLDGAFVLTDENLKKLDEFSFKIKLPLGVVPSPVALITQKAEIDKMHEGDSYYTAMSNLYNKAKEWGPACWLGYNSIKFDEKFLRMGLYKSIYNQYITNTNGSTRADLLPLMHCVKMFSPNSLSFPLTDEGKPIFKLDQLAPINNIPHEAHRSMGDVVATLELSKLVQERCSDLWTIAMQTTKKLDILQRADELVVFCHGGFNMQRDPDFGVYATIGANVNMNNELIVFNLSHDLEKYLNVSIEEMKKLVRSSDGPFKIIKANESPILLPVDYAAMIDAKFDKVKLLNTGYQIKDNFNFRAGVLYALESSVRTYKKSQIVEKQIYDGFYGEDDKNLMELFHEGLWDDKASISKKFKDSRLEELSKRILFHEKPELLDQKEKEKIAYNLAARVTSSNKQPWRTIDDAIRELASGKVTGKLSHKEMDQYEDFYQKISSDCTKILEQNT